MKVSDPVSGLALANTIIQAVIGAFTVVVAGAASAQWWQTRRSSERQLRAYVFAETFTIQDSSQLDPPQGPYRPIAHVSLKNSGQTPAYNLLHWAALDVRPLSEEERLTVPPLQKVSVTHLPPGGMSMRLLRLDRVLSESEITEIRQMTRAIYVYGRIEYEDALGRKRFTNYRLRYTGMPYPPLGGSGAPFYCDNGNEAT